MDVESLGSLPVGSLWWRFGDKPWTLSVVSKGTLDLTPGELRLASRQDPVVTLERFVGGDRNASLYAASDLVPLRPNVDVTVVGLAYAPGGDPVQELTARFQVGPLEKSVVIHGEDRSSPSGPKPFTSAPLRYELSPGGPGTANPVGVAPNSEAAPARMQRGGGRTSTSGDDLPPIGFGPLPAHWPGRRRLLKGRPVPAQPSSGGELTLPPDFSLRYYNAAPSDQQLKKLEPGTPIVLENLHPVHAVLRTRLPRISPQVFVLRDDGERVEQLATIDSLWIDTERSVAIVNWRAQLELVERTALKRVWVVITEAGKRLTWDKLAKLVDTLGAPLDKPLRSKSLRPPPPKHKTKMSERPPGPAPWSAPERNATQTTSVQTGKRMGDGPNREADPLNETQAIRLQPAKSRATPFDEETQTEITSTASVLVEMRADGTPPWLAPGAPPAVPASQPGGAPGTPALDTTPGAAPRVGQEGTDGSAPYPAPAPASLASATASAAALAASTTAGPLSGPPAVRPPTPSWISGGPTSSGHDQREDTSSLPQVVSDIRDGAHGDRQATPRDVIELLWFDKDATERVRQQWRELSSDLEFTPRDPRHDLPTDDPQQARDRHTNFGVLTQAPRTEAGQLSSTLRGAISDEGRFTPPLVVIGGRLSFPFDELEILRATAASLTPLAGDDKKLKEALANVKELLDTPLLQHSNELIDNFTNHLRGVYGQSKRALSRDYLDSTVERMLLEQRRYQKRTLFDGQFIRGLLTPPSGTEPVPAYLPEELEKKLPMMVRFDARMIVEAHVRQDQYETHPHALRVVALGRVLRLDGTEP